MGYTSKYPEGLQKYIASLVEQSGGHFNRVARETGLDHKVVRRFVKNVRAAENAEAERTTEGIDKRFKELRKLLGLTQAQFAEPLECKQTDVSRIELGDYRRLDEITSKTCDRYNVRGEWLLSGEGEIFKQSEQKEEVSEQKTILSELRAIKDLLRELIDLKSSAISQHVKESRAETCQDLLFPMRETE